MKPDPKNSSHEPSPNQSPEKAESEPKPRFVFIVSRKTKGDFVITSSPRKARNLIKAGFTSLSTIEPETIEKTRSEFVEAGYTDLG